MPRTKGGFAPRRRKKAVLKKAKGFYGKRKNLYAVAKESVDRAQAFAFMGRKEKKRQYRSLWVVRIAAAVAPFDLSYSRFINGLKRAGIELDRRVLADLAINDAKAFEAVATTAKQALSA
jgi:large subunit ribosomal protein L20